MTGLALRSDQSEAVSRILVWSSLGCTLACDDGRWQLVRPVHMAGNRGPAPKIIPERTARAAIAAGARVSMLADLFGATEMRVAA